LGPRTSPQSLMLGGYPIQALEPPSGFDRVVSGLCENVSHPAMSDSRPYVRGNTLDNMLRSPQHSAATIGSHQHIISRVLCLPASIICLPRGAPAKHISARMACLAYSSPRTCASGDSSGFYIEERCRAQCNYRSMVPRGAIRSRQLRLFPPVARVPAPFVEWLAARGFVHPVAARDRRSVSLPVSDVDAHCLRCIFPRVPPLPHMHRRVSDPRARASDRTRPGRERRSRVHDSASVLRCASTCRGGSFQGLHWDRDGAAMRVRFHCRMCRCHAVQNCRTRPCRGGRR